ncbi:MAG TPA: polysaccharide biosynthesis protein [Chitinophagaceae bacterium]|nr:polysaccharide biosynthesis protein [Chitinophagaceae bacterium]
METILITGGTGFLGRELGIQLKDRYRVILAARNNNQNQIANRMTGCEIAPLDIVNLNSVKDVFDEFNPTIVIHAAATKYVDLSEKFPNECIDVNITGSQNIARIAVQKGVKKVIGISTDKAAPPCRSTYGLSKALMERLFCAMDGKSETRFTCVRFGNIAWSTGSVFPIWKEMLEQSGDIKTTGPHMRRFFFHVSEAAKLVITAMDEINITGGKVLSRKMKAAQIEDILKLFVKLHNGTYTKVSERPGESIDETLIGISELPYTKEIALDKYPHYIITFNEKAEKPFPDIVTSANAERLNEDEIMAIISNPPKIL